MKFKSMPASYFNQRRMIYTEIIDFQIAYKIYNTKFSKIFGIVEKKLGTFGCRHVL